MLTRIPCLNLREQVTRLNQDSLNLAKPVARLEIRKNFFSELLNYGIFYPMMLNMQKIPYSLNNCMIRIIENGMAADLRKTEATSDH